MPTGRTSREPLRVKGDVAPFGLRLTPDLRAMLQREAGISGRSLNAEILARLRDTFEPKRSSRGQAAAQPEAAYDAMPATERAMLAILRRMGPEKQLAFISLFK